jgi:hypothetical protein
VGRGGERERSKPVVVVMNVADPHITTKWNMVGEGRGGEERKQAFLQCTAFVLLLLTPSLLHSFCQLSYLFSYDPILMKNLPSLPFIFLF